MTDPFSDKDFSSTRDPLAGALADGPFGRALDLAIQRSELTLEHIQRELSARGARLDQNTLSDWRCSDALPAEDGERPEIAALESVLSLPPGSLGALLADEDPADPRTDLAQLQRRMRTPRLERLMVQENYHLGPDFRHRLLRVREVVRAKRDGVGRAFVYYHGDSPLPALTAAGGCRIGRIRTDPTAGLLLAELLLERPLAVEETAVLDYELAFHGGEPVDHHERRLPLGARDYLLQVHFDPAAVPADCLGYLRPDGEPETTQQLWIGQYHTTHLVVPQPEPGNYGIRWITS
ncbi:hypothetical protein [Crossiella sp. NPDC003009]